jgi:sulfate transport system ATP-binding protein
MGIIAENITKRFGDFTALDDVGIEIPSGSLTALLGPSGSGKSTLLRVIAGLEVPDAGRVVIDDVDRTVDRPRDRGVGFVFQHYAAFRHMTVFENIAFGLRVRKRPKAEINERVSHLIDLVQLTGMAQRYPSQLSGGQRQRMALARALAVEPKVLLLDEPFGALDALVRRELRGWLRRLHDEVHVTTVLVTHDQEEAMEVADRIAVMDHARIEQVAAPRDLYEQPASQFVMGFVGPLTVLEGREVRPHEIAIDTAPVDGALSGIVRRVIHLGFEVRVEVAAPDHDDLWVQLSRHDPVVSALGPGVPVWLRSLADDVQAPGRTHDDPVAA